MSIKIKTKKVINDAGETGREIVWIKALEAEQLPALYLQNEGRPICALVKLQTMFAPEHLERLYSQGITGPGLCVQSKDMNAFLQRGDFISEARYHSLLQIIEEAGLHLKAVNETLAAKRAKWNGVETVTI